MIQLAPNCHVRINQSFMDGGLEKLIEWICMDVFPREIRLEDVQKTFNITIGPKKQSITNDELFLAYKSAELVYQDAMSFKEKRKERQTFRRKP